MCKNEPDRRKVQYYKMYCLTFVLRICINMQECAKLRALSKNEHKDEANVPKDETNVQKDETNVQKDETNVQKYA